jgi:hypothetical protein
MNSVTVGEVRREKGDVAMERKRTSVGPPWLRASLRVFKTHFQS